MFLTARLFRPGEAAQSKLLRNQPDSLIASRRFRPPDAESVHSHFPNERTSGKFVLEHRIACCNFGRWGAKVFLTFLAAQARCGVEPDDSTNKVRQSPSSRRDVQRQAILRHVQHQPRTVDVIHSEGTLRSPHGTHVA
ncbi:hypothetical protein T03_10743 [Trichinella britovi]|uniref:Uncharacterized protein n=1 Tax=Trichinella britovi TaxID=45882 RepID=A0A0V1CT58_TRIBR|nr:hypothetical protein T03_10743 [Trichinella britovi]